MKSYSDKIILRDIGLYAIAFFYLWWQKGVFPPCRKYWTMRSVGGYDAVHLMIIMMMLVMMMQLIIIIVMIMMIHCIALLKSCSQVYEKGPEKSFMLLGSLDKDISKVFSEIFCWDLKEFWNLAMAKTLLSVPKCFFELQWKCRFSRCHDLQKNIVDDVAIHQMKIVTVGGCFHLRTSLGYSRVQFIQIWTHLEKDWKAAQRCER